MKKCILIGALAALMLFAFTACEPSQINMSGSQYDYEIAKVDVASVDTSNNPMYEGKSRSGLGTVNLTYKSGKTTNYLTATIDVANVVNGTSMGTATLAIEDASSTAKPISYNVTVNGSVVLKTGIVVTNTITETDLTVKEDAYLTWNPQGTLDGLKAKISKVEYLYADETVKGEIKNFEVSFDSEKKNEITKFIVSAGEFTKEFPMDITVKEETISAKNWVVVIDDGKTELPEVGDTLTTAKLADINVDFGDSVQSVKDMIHVYSTDASNKVIEEVENYTIYGLPTTSTFSAKKADGGAEPKYNYTIQANSFVDVTFTNATGVVNVADKLKLDSIKISWKPTNDDSSYTAYAPKVGTTMPTAADFVVEAATLASGKDVKASVTVDTTTPVLFPAEIFEEQIGDYITFTLNVKYSNETVMKYPIVSATTVAAADGDGQD